MCGITGIFDLSSRSRINRDALARMNSAVSHRGPDGQGMHFEPGVGIAHRRLAIIDLATGDQPMFSGDGSIAIVFNGEIYNFRDLSRELSKLGYIFRTHSDTETIIYAWQEWGVDCVKKLHGMFAFAIYDQKKQSLFLARDRFGKKPLYYSIINNRFCLFGSELKALLASGLVPKKLRPEAVDDYMSFGYVPDPYCIYQGTFKLPAAHYLLLMRGKAVGQPTSYWQLRFLETNMSFEDARDQLISRLSEAVRIRLIADVPLGAFLSGGVDSSAIVALMSRHLGGGVKTFSIGIGGAGDDELPFASAVAARYGAEQTAAHVNPDPVAEYRRLARIFDEPFADISSVPTDQVSKLARTKVTVALSGDAGDEIFAGYRRYRWHSYEQRMRNSLPTFLRAPIFGFLGRAYPKLDWAPRWMRAKFTLQEIALDEVGGYFRAVCKIHDATRYQLYTPAFRRTLSDYHPSQVIAEHMLESDASDPVARAQYTDIKTYLPGDILTKVDRTSMASSLEVRVPMLDHSFVEWSATVPSKFKLKNGVGKLLLKRALAPYVPAENLVRTKRGFAITTDTAFRGPDFQTMRNLLNSETMRDSGIFDVASINALLSDHEMGRRNSGQALWTLLMFEGFLNEVHFATDRAAEGVVSALE